MSDKQIAVARPKRLIDDAKTPKNIKEVEVIVLGLARTGTKSMEEALNSLGYNSYHMSQIFKIAANKRHFLYWNEAIEIKRTGTGTPYGRAEFDKMLYNYTAITDVPAALLPEELFAAYPNAKYILTNRDPKKWVKSLDSTLLDVLKWPSWKYLAPFDHVFVGPFWRNQVNMVKDWSDDDMYNHEKLCEGYVEHYDRVRALVPKEQLLEFEPRDGFSAICSFLDKPLPADAKYPHVNDSAHWAFILKFYWYFTLTKTVGKCALMAASPLALAAGFGWYFQHPLVRLL